MAKHPLLLAILSAIVCAQPGGSGKNLSGVWEWDKSQGTHKGTEPLAVRMKIDQQGSAITITMRATTPMQTEENSYKLVVGEESKGEMHGSPMISKSRWEGDTLVVNSIAVIMKKDLRMDNAYTLSADGNTITLKEVNKFGDEPSNEGLRVFRRDASATWGALPPPKLAEEVYKNIQVLKGVPAPRLQGVMMNLTRWLGVRCDHCHVMGSTPQYEKDDKPAKNTTREMFAMVRQLNDGPLAKVSHVTCYTCHRGEAKPLHLPVAAAPAK